MPNGSRNDQRMKMSNDNIIDEKAIGAKQLNGFAHNSFA
jgi:hypothetical protein